MDTFRGWLLDILFPRQCLGCKVLLSDEKGGYLCSVCLAEIKIKSDFACAFCNSPVAAGLTCYFCRPGHFLDRLWVATSYENPLVKKILKTMKYRFVKTLADDIGDLMAESFKLKFLPSLNINHVSALIIPVPLHRLRFNWRGFNQAEIIGRKLGSYFGLNLRQDVLRRSYYHLPQAQITDRESRIANVKGNFECQKSELVQNKIILLVDDVATTGSTLDDCARALKGAGAKEVIGFVFAKGTPASDKKLLQ